MSIFAFALQTLSGCGTKPDIPPFGLPVPPEFPSPVTDGWLSDVDTNPGFGDLFNSEIGQIAGPRDGFDREVTVCVEILDGLQRIIDTLDGPIGDLATSFDAIDPGVSEQNFADYGTSVSNASAQVGDLGNFLSGSSPPAPPSGGGGGGGPVTTYTAQVKVAVQGQPTLVLCVSVKVS